MLFDLDGTLVDSMWMWEAIDIEFFGELTAMNARTISRERSRE